MKKGKATFRPRQQKRSTSILTIDWRDSILGWSNSEWALRSSVATVYDDPERVAQLKLVRKLIKKSTTSLIVSHNKGLSRTSKALGVRMGKGKGKITGYRLFIRKDQTLLRFSAMSLSVAKRVALAYPKRSSLKPYLTKTSF